MRILFVSSVFPNPDRPTHGIFCFNLLRALTTMHEVRAITPRPWTQKIRGFWRGKALQPRPPDPFGVKVTYPTFFYPPGRLYNTHGWFMWWSARRAIRRVVADFAPDCVLSYWAHPDGEAALRAARWLGVPVGLIVGGSDVLMIPKQSPRRGRRFAWVLRSVDAVFAVSQDLREKVIAMGVAPERAHVSYQGVDSTLFRPGDQGEARRKLGIREGVPLLLWVGRMVPVKALDVLLRACVELQQSRPEFLVCLVGDGPLKGALESEVAALGLGEVVRFVGPQPQLALPDWYRASDLVVLPSLSEGIPNVLREAHACGRPFVASRVGGIPEIAYKATDLLVEPGSVDALAAALKHALDNPPVSPVMASGQVSWEESARRLADRLRERVEARTPLQSRRAEPGDARPDRATQNSIPPEETHDAHAVDGREARPSLNPGALGGRP